MITRDLRDSQRIQWVSLRRLWKFGFVHFVKFPTPPRQTNSNPWQEKCRCAHSELLLPYDTCSRSGQVSRSWCLLRTPSLCFWGNAEDGQTKGGKEVRILPVGMQAPPSNVGMRAVHTETQPMHMLCSPVHQHHCPPGKDSRDLKVSLRAACAQKVLI